MILLMGIAGSGKGTQGELLAKSLGYTVFSTGVALRSNASEDQLRRMHNGELLGDQEIIELVDTYFSQVDPDRLILDGFPRTIGQAEWLKKGAETGRFKIEIALHLVASIDAVSKRLVDRGRSDDTEEAMRARFREYESATKPIIDWLTTHDVKVVNVDAERTVEEVNDELNNILRDIKN